MREFSIEMCDDLPDQEELDGILSQYYALIVQRMTAMGFEIDPAAPKSALAEFWARSDDYLPPNGCLVLARDRAGQIIGCGMMKRLDQETGELKRVFVTETARGTGAGRALIQAREDAARSMGLKRLVADTLTPNIEMRNLYPKLGFEELSEPIETTTYLDQPMLRPHLHYFANTL
ncbi:MULTISPECIES: GNAT family N-acetyltransferase [unclassified Ruegeria]|uniref:GNAT family N-acetyltransferase n=1 Tax=unclassified Ruegeria TaxID=2625375 RepID=UPI001ADD0AEB|nr:MULTISPECIES: GNAT family N-acetyltransferase [unclassified Ruegeria]MBO9413357.1 GNAT family N-acetyltransferase [Ruegeria sp. R8_1]MBO9414021.1 GNAT family N-acetyltransferase [Ruegeria sp. R8_2]